jgi:hypothetical protein
MGNIKRKACVVTHSGWENLSINEYLHIFSSQIVPNHNMLATLRLEYVNCLMSIASDIYAKIQLRIRGVSKC